MHINISFINILTKIITSNKYIKKFYIKTFPNSKYNLKDILTEILFILKTGISWRDNRSNINYQSIYYHFKRFVNFGIFKKLFIKLRSTFIKSHKTNVQIIDSTFIMNKFGKNFTARNKFFKSKNCNKVSLLTDINGIPLSALINLGNIHDINFLKPHLNDLYYLNKKYNNHVQILADKGYESKIIRSQILPKYSLMIPKKSNMKITYSFDKLLYKNRIHIEHSFSKLKVFRRIMVRYDSNIINFNGFLFLALSQIIFNKL